MNCEVILLHSKKLIDIFKSYYLPLILAWNYGSHSGIEEMGRQGFTIPSMVRKLKELLEAKHPFRSDQADNKTQRKALEIVFKLYGVFPHKSKENILIETKSEEEISQPITEDDHFPL